MDPKTQRENKKQVEKLRKSLLFLCEEEKEPDSCHQLAHYYESTAQNHMTARVYYERNCLDNKYPDSCFKMGSYMILNYGGCKGMQKEGIEILNKNCDETGHRKSCTVLGDIYRLKVLPGNIKNTDFNLEKSFECYRRSCDKGDGRSCTLIGNHYYNGQIIEQNATKAFDYYRRGCDLLNLKGCNNAAAMAEHGFKEVEPNKKLFQEYSDKFNFLNKNQRRN